MVFRKAVPIFFVYLWEKFDVRYATLTNGATNATAPTLVMIATRWMLYYYNSPEFVSLPAGRRHVDTSTSSQITRLARLYLSPRLFPFSVFHRVIRPGRVSMLQTRKKALNRPLIAHVSGTMRLVGAGRFKHIPIANNPCAQIRAAGGCGHVSLKSRW